MKRKQKRASRFLIAAIGLLLAFFSAASAPARGAGGGGALRFAWLSDTHIGAGGAEGDLRLSVADINAQAGLSFVIVSGDITEAGSMEQYRLARGILDGLGIPCHVIPGNHDCKWSDSGAAWFGRIFGDTRFAFDAAGFRFIGVHEGPIMKMGDGHFAPEDLRWLAAQLDQLEKTSPGRPVIFVTHFPLDNRVDNWFEATGLLKRHNTQAVLVGHGHANVKLNFEGLPAAMGRSNLRDRKKNTAPGYTIVKIKNGVMTFTEKNPGRPAPPAPWYSIKLEKHDYAGAAGNPALPDYSINKKYPNVKILWQQDLGWTTASSPALHLAGNSAIIGDASGKVRAFSLDDGHQLWEFATGGPVYSTPAVDTENETGPARVVFASTDGGVYALDAATGARLWQFQTPALTPIVASPRIDGGAVYIGASDNTFRALDLRSGKLLWEFKGLRGFVETRPLVHEGKVIFGAWDEHLYALDAKTGALAWKWRGPNRGPLLSPAACWPVAAHGKIFITAPDRKVTALRAATGAEVWRAREVSGRESIGISGDGATIYVRAMTDTIAALATAPDKPTVEWQTNAAFGYDYNSAMLEEKDGTLFYGTKNGLLYAIDSKTGKIKWQHKTGPTLINTVVPLSARKVLLSDFDGKLTLLGACEACD